ncbi:MAG: formimidoylglutamate deiminase [Bdellovibrionota bacterium]
MSWIKFTSAYVGGSWKSPFFVQLDKDGAIQATSSDYQGPVDEVHDHYLIPGLPNGHSHSFQYVMAGLSERVAPGREKDDFWFWREQMYRLANTIQLDELLSVTTRLYSSMLEYGYTSVAEFHYLHHDLAGKKYDRATQMSEVILEAAKQAKIKLTLIPVYYNQAAPGVPIKDLQKRFYFENTDLYLTFLEDTAAFAKTNYPTAKIGYGVHSLRAAPLADIKRILSKAWTNGPCHLHASEQIADVESFVSAYGIRPINWLADHAPLGPQHNLVHATHLSAEERQILAKSGATVVLCPTTEANLGDGLFPFLDYHSEGGSWSVGSDSQVNLSPFVEMTAMELTQRLLDRKRNVLVKGGELVSGDILFNAALKGGRKSVGLLESSFAVGTLFEGVLIDRGHDRIYDRPLDSVLSILCYAPEKDMIKSVFSEGAMQVKDGAHRLKSDRDSYRKSLGRLLPLITDFK